jgi:hypothetical protein
MTPPRRRPGTAEARSRIEHASRGQVSRNAPAKASFQLQQAASAGLRLKWSFVFSIPERT